MWCRVTATCTCGACGLVHCRNKMTARAFPPLSLSDGPDSIFMHVCARAGQDMGALYVGAPPSQPCGQILVLVLLDV